MSFLTVIFSFGEGTIEFQCRYSRSVSVNSDLTVAAAPTGPTIGTGDLTYEMNVDGGSLGGTTNITISPNHNIAGISPR